MGYCSTLQHHDLVGDRHRVDGIVCDEHGRSAVLAHRAKQVGAKLRSDGGIERRKGFVEQQQLRTDGEGPGERDALRLPSGELRRPHRREMCETEPVEQVEGCPPSIHRPISSSPQPERDIFERGEVRKEQVALKDDADSPIGSRHMNPGCRVVECLVI